MPKSKYYAIAVVFILIVVMIPFLATIIKKSTPKVASVKVKEEYFKKPAQTVGQTQGQAGLIIQHLKDGESKLAIRLAKEYLTSNPNDITIINILTEAYIQESDLSAAETAVKRAIAIQPNNAWSSRLLSRIYRDRAKFEKSPDVKSDKLILAEKEVEKGLASNPNDAWLLVEAAEVYLAQGDKVKANQKIDRAISIDPKNAYIKTLKEKMNK